MTAAAEGFHSCTMCSYGARTEEAITSHVCKSHRNDPRFHVYCRSCLRSYKKWGSYRKHVERGCKMIPSMVTVSDDTAEELEVDTIEETSETGQQHLDVHLNDASRQWHEAAYVLSIKEKHVLPQVAVDRVLSSTRDLVSEVLTGIMNDIRGSIPANSMSLIEEKVDSTKDTLFEAVSTAFLQNKYFKEHFNLVVSSETIAYAVYI